MNKLEYLESLPKKRMGAGIILLDSSKRVLIVKPTYKDHWEIPGGVVEKDESPLAATLRELQEETGLILSRDEVRLVGVDYLHQDKERTEALMFVFFGGIISASIIGGIRLAKDELTEYCFASVDEAERMLGATVGPRVARCYASIMRSECCIYFEDRR
jgi:8-oxo-dGTP diphosphatase